jgi:sulfate transport system ATP-binding protein
LLLDEPFGALDAKVRKDLRRWLRRLHDELHITSVFVTHDQEEALEVADRIVVMNHGNVEQIGSPQEVYDNPASPFVYKFLGNVNLFHSRVTAGRANIGEIELQLDDHHEAQDSPAFAYVRPHDIEILKERTAEPSFEAVVSYVHAIGPLVRLELERADHTELVEAELTRERFKELDIAEGARVFVQPRNVRVFLDPASTS